VPQDFDQLPVALEFVIEAWGDLPEETREKIVEITLQDMKNVTGKGENKDGMVGLNDEDLES